jgi:hypothetical protein
MLCVRASDDGCEEELTIALNPINMKPGALGGIFRLPWEKTRWKNTKSVYGGNFELRF